MTMNLQIIDASEKDINWKYHIMLFCIDENSNSYCIKVKNYNPFFYINYNKNFHITDMNQVIVNPRCPNDYYKTLKGNTTNISIHNYKELDGYQDRKKKFIKLEFDSIRKFGMVKKAFEDKIKILGEQVKFQRYESNINQFLRFFHIKNINLCKWIKINKSKATLVENEFSKCKFEYEVDFRDIHRSNIEKIGPMKILSYDIECASDDGGFPQFSREADKIIQIGNTMEVYGKGLDADVNFIICLKNCQPIDNCEVINCKTEKELIQKWCEKINEIDPDIITGYNIWGFDYQYIFERAKLLNLDIDTLNISRIHDLAQTNFRDNEKIYIIKQLTSSAMGDNQLKYLNTAGRINIDLIKYVRENEKLPVYKLDYVAEHFIGQKKNPVTPKQIFDWYREGKAEKITVIAKYCIQDCKLVNKLINKLSVVENSVGMSNTCWIPLNYVFCRGQGIKAHSLVLKECASLGFIMPHIEKLEGECRFKGATVLTAKSGIHYYPVSALDFASLYPSCMISHNICISSLITKEKLDECIEKFNWTIDKYREVKWDETDKDTDITTSYLYYYVQPDKDINGKIIDSKRAVFPQILMKLLNKRNETKKLMKKEKDPFKKSIYNGLQLSYKITANSIYGQLGSPVGAMRKLAVAGSVTTCGRQLLELAQNFTLQHYEGSDAIYGDTDSIFMKFNLKDHTCDCPYHQKNIHKRIAKYHRIKNKICKKMIINNEKFSHSREAEAMMFKTKFRLYKKCDCPHIKDLMSENALKKSIEFASEVDAIITDLLPDHKVFVDGKQVDGCQQLEYEKTYLPYILFTKKRYVGKLYEFKTNLEKDWVLDYKGIALKRRDSSIIVKKFYKHCLFKIMEGSKQIALDCLEKDLSNLMNNDKTKIYPIEDFVLSKTLKSMNKYKMDKKILQSILILNKFLQLKNILNQKNYDLDIIDKIIDNNPSRPKFSKITCFESCDKHSKFDTITGNKKLSFKMNCKCNKDINNTFGINQLLDFLNTKYNSKVVKKEDRNINDLSRLKTYRFNKKVSFDKNIIDIIDLLSEYYLNNNQKVLLRIKNIFKKITVSKIYERISFYNLRKVSQTHVILTQRMTLRDPGSAPQINDRIQYCFIKVKGDTRKMLQGDLIENPDYITQNNIPLNYNYYIEKQIQNPLLQLFEHVDKEKSKKIFLNIKNLNKNKSSGQTNIMDFFK